MQTAEVREPLPPPEEIEQLTREVLSSAEFQTPLGDRASDLFWDLFETLLAELAGWAAANPLLVRLLNWMLLALLILLLGYLVSTMLRTRGGGGSVLRLPLESSASWKSLEGLARNWEDALRQAREALTAGDLYRALWIAHRTLLALLDYRGLVQFAKWKTNRDYLRECPRESGTFGLLDAVTGAYDTVVYAHRDLPADRVGGLLERIERERTDV